MPGNYMTLSERWKGRCHRCGTETDAHTMSRFNTDLICMDCCDAEEQHPDYEHACRVEHEATRQGNWNHPGVGWPGVNGRVRR